MAQRLLVKTSNAHSALRNMVRNLAAPFDPAARQGLLTEIKSGSLTALAAYGEVRDLPQDVASTLILLVSDLVDRQIRDTRLGHYVQGGLDVGRNLALLNARFPDHANWEPLFTLLSDQFVATEHKAGALQELAALADEIEGDTRTRLSSIALSLAKDTRTTKTFWGTRGASIRGDAVNLAVALGAIEPETAAEHMSRLLSGTVQERVWAVRIARQLSQPEHLGLFMTLSQDPDPLLRANAAAAIAALVAADKGGTTAVAALQRCLKDPGACVPKGIAEALTAAPTLSRAARDALASLRHHPSARVRATSYRSPGLS